MDNHRFLKIKTGLSIQDFKTLEPLLFEFNRFLTLRTFVGGYTLSQKDTTLWAVLCSNKVALGLVRRSTFVNITRWFTHLESTYPEVQHAAQIRRDEGNPANSQASQIEGRYNIQLQDAGKGVVTRFPPEPSGYLHIGHAKAAFLNDYFAHDAFQGSLILRFDDTNPKKEKQEYEDSIVEDLALLGIQCQRVTYTSDYFEQLYQLCQKLISDGNAYADDTDAEKQKKDRYNRLPSARRDRPAGESLAILAEMREGSDFGKQHCIRARIMFDSDNGALRDPIIYRFPRWGKDETPHPHHRTGWAWHIYPTYDFACPLVDSIEGVTHALRTTEYSDRNEQYYWFLKALAMRHVHLWDFARIHFIRTFLSKRKLSKVVDTGRVTGWDDPRMPTVRGIFRRGLQMDTLREFMLKQGPSRNVVTMDWTILWAMNKKAIDPVAPRHTAVATKHSVLVTVIGGPDVPYSETRPKHPKNPAVGIKTVTFANEIFLDQADAALLQQDEEITIMSWGNAFVRRITKSDQGIVADLSIELHLEGSVTKANKKVHWLAAHGSNLVQAELWDFDHLLNKDVLEKGDDLERFLNPVTATTTDVMLDSNSAALSEGEVIQLERKGYYRVDKSIKSGATGKVVLFKIPTGTTRG
ncbi:glutamyl-tRNA synthetase [Metarhizium rileyi]|uniref:glutamate--tRNA ligase n=1 Tax=Metarhizium rileyi (strain RCEF 4871) TaxID=1649241 RepID=A0A162J4R8_METRR|nr:glutamyl-tRNA synthetase [Metarhizium rileyi RCEF 4871]